VTEAIDETQGDGKVWEFEKCSSFDLESEIDIPEDTGNEAESEAEIDLWASSCHGHTGLHILAALQEHFARTIVCVKTRPSMISSHLSVPSRHTIE
jgi:hypothetical protein